MAGMSFIGSYSGIDQSTIDQLMEAEKMPLKQLTNKQLNITEKKDAWKDVNTRLNSLFDKMKALKSSSSFKTKTATSSDDKFVSMSAGTAAAEGKYMIQVKRLASNSSIVGKQVIVDDKDADGNNIKNPPLKNVTGKFTIKNGDTDSLAAEIEVVDGDSLRAVADKINAVAKDYKKDGSETLVKGSGTGITATIIDNRIVLNDEKTGKRDIVLEEIGTGNALEGIGLDSVGTWNEETGQGLKQGKVALFTLNGIPIESDTNTVKNVVDGLVINLNKVHSDGQSDTITISSDNEKAAQAVQDFVDQYNSTMKFIEEKTAGGDAKVAGSKGSLAGESSLIRLQTSLRRIVTDKLGTDDDSIRDASQIGISTFDKFGALTFDKDKFIEELEKDGEAVMNFFNPKEGGGLVDKVNTYIDSFISKSNGIIKDKNSSFERSLKDLDSRIESFEARMVKKEAYYIKTFTALDIAMMKAEDQMGWLQGQVDSMNGVGR